MRRRLAAVVLVGAVFAGAVGSSTAGAQSSANAEMMRVELSKDARKVLRKSDIRVTATAAGGSAKRAIRIPIASGEVGGIATMELEGRLRFEGKQRSQRANVGGLSAVLDADGGFLSGRMGGTQYTVLELKLDPDAGTPFDPLTGEVDAVATTVRLPKLVRTALAEKLREPRRKLPRKLGPGTVRAQLETAPAEQTSPPARQRPAGALDVTAAEITWRARESWVNYLHDAPNDQGGANAKDGATDGAAETIPPSPEARVYEFTYPFASGWYDPATDTARIDGTGTVNYFKLIDPFQIDLDVSAPELELGGPQPRLIGLLNGRRNSDDQQNRRAVLVDLDQAAVTPTEVSGPGGTTVTFEGIPGLVPEGSDAWPIAGFYQPGSEWGSVSVEFTYEHPAP
jgi:hypothetical protein